MKAAAGLAIAIALLLALNWAVTGEGAIAVVFGWIPFLRRVLPRMQIDGESVVVGAVAIAFFTSGVHWLARGAFRAVRPNGGRWRFRWSASIVVMVITSFAAGVAIVGIVHQVGWIAKSQAPLRVEAIPRGYLREPHKGIRYLYFGASNSEAARGHLPTAATLDESGQPLHGWETQILPFVNYYLAEIDQLKPWDDPANEHLFKTVIPEFINADHRTPPTEDENGYGLNHYSANNRLFVEGEGLKQDEIADGTQNTIMLGEAGGGFSPWGRPRNVRDPAAGIRHDGSSFGGPEVRGATYFVMVDGSVQLIDNDVDEGVLKALSTPAGGD